MSGGSGGSGSPQTGMRELESVVAAVCGLEIGQKIIKKLVGGEFSAVCVDDLRGLDDPEWAQFEAQFGSSTIRDLRSRLSPNAQLAVSKADDPLQMRSALAALASAAPPSVTTLTQSIGAVGPGAVSITLHVQLSEAKRAATLIGTQFICRGKRQLKPVCAAS